MQLKNRLKNYSKQTRNFLDCNKPVVIRLDGLNYKRVLKLYGERYGHVLTRAMQKTAKLLEEHVDRMIFTYGYRDKIIMVIQPRCNDVGGINRYKTVSKSVSACTYHFNRVLQEETTKEKDIILSGLEAGSEEYETVRMELDELLGADSHVLFMCDAFNVPIDEITSYLALEQDRCKNISIQSYAGRVFDKSEMYKKSIPELCCMLQISGNDWEGISSLKRRGWILTNGEYNEDLPLFADNELFIRAMLE